MCEFIEQYSQGDSKWEDVEASGFIPLFSYPKEAILPYLQANPDETITPLIAREHPDLSERFPVDEWVCTACNETYPWDSPDRDEYPYQPPICPNCSGGEGHPVELTVAGHSVDELNLSLIQSVN